MFNYCVKKEEEEEKRGFIFVNYFNIRKELT